MHSTSANCLTDANQTVSPAAGGELPFVSLLVACRNEEKYISKCLDSILASDYPKERMEVLVIDGMSVDRTRQIVKDYAKRNPSMRLLDNAKIYFPSAMNVGIQNARGDVVLITSAHSLCDSKYVSACVRYQLASGAENVGGVLRIRRGAETATGGAIAVALGSKFGSGNAYVKTGVDQPTWADTAAFGCYRRELFGEIGMFDERLLSSSDLDFNGRILAAGGKILLVPEIVVQYFADATLGAFWKHNFADGVWISYVMKFGRRAFSWRHWVPAAFVLSLVSACAMGAVNRRFLWLGLGIAAAYAAVNVAVSLQIAVREWDPRHAFLLPVVFLVRHFAHGIGTLYGLVLVVLPGEHWKGRRGRKA
ncbi:MAG TPA: glycosyltransferase family 2 protein [Candidatus Sulfotelmatobacter sp.]|nr:glycosyltransferase family 2 protein [Candidatus Sulfotelmatobacter sp.]HEV2418098.1 glycosyltransferase family 2 protein [Terriglobia bacterium]